MEKFKFISKEEIKNLPIVPGVYLFKDREDIIYVGKAVNLKERIKNHFQQPGYRDYLFLDKVREVGYLETNSEIEALILEANLIKKYQPKYNVVWRDDKNYFFVGITKEIYPRIFLTHQPSSTLQKAIYIGPFVDGQALKQALKTIRKVFPYRSCRVMPKHPCLWYQLKRCPAPCQFELKLIKEIKKSKSINAFRKEYQKNIRNLIDVLRGKKKKVLLNLKTEMKKYSGLKIFEKAAEIKDQIISLEKVLAHARIFFKSPEELKETSLHTTWRKTEAKLRKILKIRRKKIKRIEAYDVSNIQGKSATGSMVTFFEGVPEKNSYRRFKIKTVSKPNDIAMIKECLTRRFRHLKWAFPDLILIDGGKAHLNAAVDLKNKNKMTKNIKIMAIAKRKNEFFIENEKKPFLLKNLPREIFNLILQLRDEAHRFAITYHRKLRKKGIFHS